MSDELNELLDTAIYKEIASRALAVIRALSDSGPGKSFA